MTKRKQPEVIPPSKKASDLAEAHWKYVEELLKVHGTSEALSEIIGFHYRTAMIHGYKHGYEDAMTSQLS